MKLGPAASGSAFPHDAIDDRARRALTNVPAAYSDSAVEFIAVAGVVMQQVGFPFEQSRLSRNKIRSVASSGY